MNRFLLIVVIIFTVMFVYYDSQKTDGLFDTIRFITYALLINILTHKIVTNGDDKEKERLIGERNLLQTLLLKKNRISSQKLQKTIRKAEANENNKKRKR